MFHLLGTSHLYAQTDQPCEAGDCDCLMEKAENEARNPATFTQALNHYFTVTACDESRREEVEEKIADLFERIEELRKNEETARKRAAESEQKINKSLQEIQTARKTSLRLYNEAETGRRRTRAVLDNIYFYRDSFGLAYRDGKYGFIDKDLRVKIGFNYSEAHSFDYTGLAMVKRSGSSQPNLLINTRGEEFTVVYDIHQLTLNTQALDLRNQGLDSLPVAVCRLPDLKILLLGGNQLKELPDEIGQLAALSVLDISGNNLENLPKTVSRLTNLEYLNAALNAMTRLPDSIDQLTNLKTLYLFGNKLDRLPESIGRLTNLDELEIGSNKIRQLPESICNLTNLTLLGLFNNQLSALPDSIGRLTRLTRLDLTTNGEINIPDSFWTLTNLNSLSLGGNRLAYGYGKPREDAPIDLNGYYASLAGSSLLSARIGNFTNLKELNLGGMQLKGLPVEIWNLRHLVSLDLSRNQIIDLPDAIKNLKNLTSLSLKGTELSRLPAAMWRLTGLNHLNLAGNKLEKLPESIGVFSDLRFLDLSDNPLGRLPDSLGQLTQLTTLDLSGIGLSELPPFIRNLTNLESLDLSKNHLADLPDIWDFTRLYDLHLNGNDLIYLPDSIGKLAQLSILDLSGNRLKGLPETIGRLSNLSDLDLSDNDLERLPESMGRLSELVNLNLSENDHFDQASLPGILNTLSKPVYLTSRPFVYANGDKGVITVKLGKNSILSESILAYADLTGLELVSCDLEAVPDFVGRLAGLETLDLMYNHIKILPETIGQMAGLVSLNLYSNRLKQLPETLKRNKNLVKLDLERNPFSLDYINQLRVDMPWCRIDWEPLTADALFKIGEYREAYEAEKAMTEKDPGYFGYWSNLSKYAWFTGETEMAVRAAQKSLELFPKNQQVETKLALSYLLNNQWEEAERIYLKWKGKSFSNRSEPANNIFLKDIDDLEAAGIRHPDFEKARALLKE
ncbi:MAG TPA: hypothetical protein PKB07_04715 [Flavilitoribacter sp.]|nr:hypothetical protein [Flavilitoribacter sp.]